MYSVFPPALGMIRADNSDAFAGTALNELSACHCWLALLLSTCLSTNDFEIPSMDSTCLPLGRRCLKPKIGYRRDDCGSGSITSFSICLTLL